MDAFSRTTLSIFTLLLLVGAWESARWRSDEQDARALAAGLERLRCLQGAADVPCLFRPPGPLADIDVGRERNAPSVFTSRIEEPLPARDPDRVVESSPAVALLIAAPLVLLLTAVRGFASRGTRGALSAAALVACSALAAVALGLLAPSLLDPVLPDRVARLTWWMAFEAYWLASVAFVAVAGLRAWGAGWGFAAGLAWWSVNVLVAPVWLPGGAMLRVNGAMASVDEAHLAHFAQAVDAYRARCAGAEPGARLPRFRYRELRCHEALSGAADAAAWVTAWGAASFMGLAVLRWRIPR
ncbi:MAG: hypothetical protein FJX76_26850 [Armatimonadetes bacterium]|nr:hypothetical protein [Armatimonadota bacterium]